MTLQLRKHALDCLDRALADKDVVSLTVWFETYEDIIRAALTDKEPDEQGCEGCPKDVDCEDYRIDGKPCEGKSRWFKCNVCGKLLPTENGLEKHKRYHKPDDAEVKEAIHWAKSSLCVARTNNQDRLVKMLENLITAASRQSARVTEDQFCDKIGSEILSDEWKSLDQQQQYQVVWDSFKAHFPDLIVMEDK